VAEETLSSSFAESGQRLLPAHLRFGEYCLKAWIGPKRIKRLAGREGRGHNVPLLECSAKIREPLLVLAYIAEQPSDPEDKFRVVMNFQPAEIAHGGEHLRWAPIEPSRKAVAPHLEGTDTAHLTHFSEQRA
jgi:hypothetical protein